MSGLKSLLATTKGKIIAGVSAGIIVVAIVGIIVGIILSNDGYRSILVEEVVGTIIVIGDKNNGQAYTGQRLYNGDDVTVKEASELTLCIDNDKYVYADENTHFVLESASSKESNKIKIVLDKGSELNKLTQKLGENDTYEVDTPNSTMSVRGTVFRMTVYTGTDGYIYTLLEVEEGVVLVELKTKMGEYNGVEKEFYAGESALIRANDDISEFVLSEEGTEVLILDYLSLPTENVPRLIALLDKIEGNTVILGDNDEDESRLNDVGDDKIDEEDADSKEDEEDADDKDEDKDTEDDVKTEDKKTSNDSSSNNENNNTSNSEGGSVNNNSNSDNNSSNNSSNNSTNNNSNSSNSNSGGNSSSSNNSNNSNNNSSNSTSHKHSFGAWITIKEATCTIDGVQERVCSCGEKETQTIPATGHKWSTITDSQPTCTATGSKHDECTVCHAKEPAVSIPATGHKMTWVTDKEPSCGANGTSSKSGEGQKHQQCSVCGYDDPNSYTSIPALTHTYSAIGYQSNGGSTHTVTYECPNCHDSYTTSESCDMADVVTGYLPGDPATGVSGYNVISYMCQKCGYVQQTWNQPIYP